MNFALNTTYVNFFNFFGAQLFSVLFYILLFSCSFFKCCFRSFFVLSFFLFCFLFLFMFSCHYSPVLHSFLCLVVFYCLSILFMFNWLYFVLYSSLCSAVFYCLYSVVFLFCVLFSFSSCRSVYNLNRALVPRPRKPGVLVWTKPQVFTKIAMALNTLNYVMVKT